ncbi:hypothetical protein K8W59_19705 [Nocardioides rotundus]|uniref:hypothetical protein n=1 Tax=Nocardioides rotundus TaxID=1774216 RepID=UPI001CBA7906|nr:hypothetical protein [Nocardioides rotundus]UAL29917.1 hypothetical protein K8W59_19705 [Nocardioides rotundus]
MTNHDMPAPSAFFDASTPAVVIDHLEVTDSDVVNEARRWSSGRRAASVAAADLADADLGPFVSQALAVGARAIASAGHAQDTFELERLVAEVGTKTVESSGAAAEVTAKAAAGAAETMGKATETARKALVEAEAAYRKDFAETVAASTKAMRGAVEQLFGGESPELLAKLGPVLDAAGHKIGQQAFEQTDKLLEKVSRQFNPDDPTSPFAKQAKVLADQQKTLTDTMDKNHLALVGKVDELAKAVEVQKAANEAAAKTASVTPLKGSTYEAAVNRVMDGIAAGLGDEYAETGTTVGVIPNCRKGDGLLTIAGGAARVVVEMHDSTARRAWGDYLDEAERNRDAAASIGLVPAANQNGDQAIRVLGPRRIVMAFDPERDQVDLLRTVVQLVRTSAVVASSRRDVEGIETAEECIQQAVIELTRIDSIRTASGSIRKNADKIDKECNSVQSSMQRLLNQALDALSGVALEATDIAAENSTSDSAGVA